MPNQPGPLEQLARHPVKGYVDHCEMCGKPTRNAMLEPAFDPGGEAKILCRQCRIGSAELLHDQRTNLLKACREAVEEYKLAKIAGFDPRMLVCLENTARLAEAAIAKVEGRR